MRWSSSEGVRFVRHPYWRTLFSGNASDSEMYGIFRYDHSVLRGTGSFWWFWGTCTRANCPISSTKLCLLRNAVYQIMCSNCNQHYIGSTTRFIHDRVREDLNNGNSSMTKHISKCQNKVYKGIEIKTIILEKYPANLRLFEAFYIRNYKPTIDQLPRRMQRIRRPFILINNYFNISRDSLYHDTGYGLWVTVYYVDFFVFFVLRSWRVLQVLTCLTSGRVKSS